ncbi:hypothetical protein KSS87_013981 [Heliosperma pusillum]|nr:hypothetical protein KSS87_013981 [Heliosperma pusillum]
MRTGSQDAYVLLSHRTLSDSIAKHWKTDEAKAIDVKLHIQIYKEGVDDTYGQREEVEEKCKAREMKRERRSEEKDKEKEKEDMGMEESKPKLYVFKSSYKPE